MKNNSGFTLIEVLIASLILFSSLALIAELFSSSLLTSNKASETTKLYQVSPAAITSIKSQIRSSKERENKQAFSGTVIVQGVVFDWQASLISLKRPPTFLGDIGSMPEIFGRYNVSVIAHLDEKLVPFEFEVATW